jgi:hypothetical protein
LLNTSLCVRPLDGGDAAQGGVMATQVAQEERANRTVRSDEIPPARKWSPGVAALLSLLIPGAGQMYKGQGVNGLTWLFLTMIGYLLIVPGLILHICCIFGAASGDPTK